jgi:hypothetical protein
MATKKVHRKPTVPREAAEAEKVAKTMYSALTAAGAPRATPVGYIMGAGIVLKMLIDQAVTQGENRETLKAQAMAYIQMI